MKDLPRFQRRHRDHVMAFINHVFMQGSSSYLRDLIEYDDGHYRVVFDMAIFSLQSGQTQPSKSQWNNLKKKLKRHDPKVFMFKAHGEVDCGNFASEKCGYMDFGFFAE
jgi:hypothetical protein